MVENLQRALTNTLKMLPGTPPDKLLNRVAQIQAQLERAITRIQQLEQGLYQDPGDDLAYGHPGHQATPHRPDPTELDPDDPNLPVGPYHHDGIPPWA